MLGYVGAREGSSSARVNECSDGGICAQKDRFGTRVSESSGRQLWYSGERAFRKTTLALE